MKNKKILGVVLATMFIATAVSKVNFADKQYELNRVQGKNRYETSAQISRQLNKQNDKVVLVSGENFADALTAGNLSDVAPILLTEKDGISPQILDEIARLKAKEVIIVGGEGSVSKNIEKQLEGKKITRISGKNRYETSTKLFEQLKSKRKNIVLANGNSFADALAAAPFAVQKNQTLVLTDGKNLPDDIKAEDVKTIIGGKNSVNIKGLEKAERISGKNRYETSLEVMKRMNKTEKAVLADGRNYPDALSAAPLAVKMNTGILLSDDTAIDSIKSYIDKAGIKNVTIIGGENSVSKTQYQKLTGEYKPETKPANQDKTEKKPEKTEPKNTENKTAKSIDLSNFNINTPLSQREKELAKLVNEYRKSKGLKPLKVSKSLTFVARTHNLDQVLHYRDDWKDNRGMKANFHSWSDKGNGRWTPVMYTEDHKYAVGMWEKPKELTPYTSDGFEISYRGGSEPEEALECWKKSPGHNSVIIGEGYWKDLTIMGVSIHDGFADIWFGAEPNDPAGFHTTN